MTVVNEDFILKHRDDPNYYEVIYNQYEKLIHKIAHRYFIIGYDYEDLVSEGTIKFFHILKEWKPEKGCKFSSLLGVALDNHYKMMLRYHLSSKRYSDKPVLSLDTPIGDNTSDPESIKLQDIIKDPNVTRDFSLDPCIVDVIESYCSTLKNERVATVLKMYLLQELTQCEIANLTGVSQAQISRDIKKHSKHIKTLYEKGKY